MLYTALALTVVIGATGSSAGQYQAIRQAVALRHGPNTRVTSILTSRDTAIVRADGVHDGLRETKGGWHIVCSLGAGAPTATMLERKCGFSSAAAMQLSADEAANAAAGHGDFTTASKYEQAALHSVAAPLKPSEAARLQLLNELNQQMQIGQVSRSDAIRKWNEVRLSVFLP